MPRRTNDFQTLIALIERQLAESGVQVTESRIVRDVVIDQGREVDIYMVTTSGDQRRTIGIECVDHRRKADITWVEGRVQKHRDLDTDQLVLVSRSGFTKAARKKAEQHGAQTLAVEQATEADWASLLTDDVSLRTHRVEVESFGIEVPYDSQLVVEVPRGEVQPWTGEVQQLEEVLYASDGSRLGTVKELLERAKSTPGILNDFARRAPRNGDEAPLAFDVHLPSGAHWLDADRNPHAIVSLRFRGIGRTVTDRMPLSFVRYRDKVVLSGSADIDGARHVVSGVHPSDTRFSLGISPSPGAEPVFLEVEVTPSEGGTEASREQDLPTQ